MAPAEMPLGQFALRWILDHPAVSTIIAGTTRPEQVAENAGASQTAALDLTLREKLTKFYWDRVRRHVRGPV
jgi:aryl-alcohol dehydrogenase-like predicted oxidoreductase